MNANGLTLLKRHLTDILSDRIVDLSPVYGGRNSRVYHAICENRLALAVKVYFRDPKDKRNRLATEWAACTGAGNVFAVCFGAVGALGVPA